MNEVFLILFGWFLGCLTVWLDRKRRLRAHWFALRAEMTLCHDRASTLLKDDIRSPLYRLPSSAYECSLPALLSEGAVSESDLLTLGRFFCQVQDINRGMDNAAAFLGANDAAGLDREYDRNVKKARALVAVTEDAESLHTEAKQVVDAKIRLWWWRY